MNRALVAFTVWSALLAAARGAPSSWHHSELRVPHSAVALMPEGTPTDYDLFRPLRPTVVVWGEDALSALDGTEPAITALRRNSDAYRRVGVTQLATNVWMLTATERYLYAHPELASTSCIDLWGEKIVPRWLADADYHGTKPWWGCTNQPRYQQHLMARLRAGLAAGATMVHLDDHSGTLACAAGAGGCFCADCVEGFRAWLGRHVDPAALTAAGVSDPTRFDYRAFLQARHYPSRDAFIHETWAGRVPLWSWFLAYQRDAALAFIARLQQEAAKAAGHPVPFGVNAYNLDPKQLYDAHVVDYFANEVQQFDQEDFIPPVVYQLGEALGRPTFATGTGEDWIAYRQTHATNRVRGWIAEAYAFGQYFMYAWKKWGFSEKTGTLWTEVDPDVFAPMCAFVSGHAALFDGLENAAPIGLLYDNASANHGRWGVRTASAALLSAGLPYRLVVSGDDTLRAPLNVESFNGLLALVVPADTARSPGLTDSLATWTRAGGRVLAETELNFPGLDSARIEIETTGRVWALPRVDRGSAAASKSASEQGAGQQRWDPQRPRLVVHLLNRDYAPATDSFSTQHNVRLTLDPAAFGGPAPVRRVRYFAPGRVSQELRFTVTDRGAITLEVPALEIWGIVEME